MRIRCYIQYVALFVPISRGTNAEQRPLPFASTSKISSVYLDLQKWHYMLDFLI